MRRSSHEVILISLRQGWGVPVAVTPEGDDCDEIACTPTISTCPDPQMMLKDSYGTILGCKSACYTTGEDRQCCKGDYSDSSKCTPDGIQYYDYFKKPCSHAYAYFEDSRTGSPTVQYLCKAEGAPGFEITFCPDGDGDSGGSRTTATTTGGTAAAPTATADIGQGTRGTTSVKTGLTTAATGTATGTAPVTATAAEPTAPPQVTAASSSGASAGMTPGGAADLATQSLPTLAGTASDGAVSGGVADPGSIATAADSAASASASSDGSSSSGVSTTTMVGVGAGVAVVAAIGVVIACVISRRKKAKPAAQVTRRVANPAAAAPESDLEASGQAAAGRASGGTSSRSNRLPSPQVD